MKIFAAYKAHKLGTFPKHDAELAYHLSSKALYFENNPTLGLTNPTCKFNKQIVWEPFGG
jgi:hypothetical protein